MARIRCIKPEFPQSESMGRVSRDARLTFIQMWTLADDEGRLRGNSRMLASLLFPYDDDAPGLIDGWMAELEKEGCIARYKVEGQSYIQICNWLIHQKIDKPSKSKIPAFVEHSRMLSNALECSRSVVLGSKEGIKEGIEGSKEHAPALELSPEDQPENVKAVLAMRSAGVFATKPSDPELLAAISEGVTSEQLAEIAADNQDKPQLWIVRAARGRLRDAKAEASKPRASANGASGSVAAVTQNDHSKTMAEVLRGQC